MPPLPTRPTLRVGTTGAREAGRWAATRGRGLKPQVYFICMDCPGCTIRHAVGAAPGRVDPTCPLFPAQAFAGRACADTRPTSGGSITKATRRTVRTPPRHARPSPPPSFRCEIRLTFPEVASGERLAAGCWVVGGGHVIHGIRVARVPRFGGADEEDASVAALAGIT
jgi:hypothetical protein